MKKLLLLSFLLLHIAVYGQKILKVEKVTDACTHITGNNFIGVIFSKEYSHQYLSPIRFSGVIYAEDDNVSNRDVLDKYQRFSADTSDILLSETLLQANLRKVNKKLGSPKYWRGPIVYKHLEKYARQYFGFLNERNEKVIFIYSYWDYEKNEKPYFDDTFHFVFDGGSYFWQIKINLKTHQLYDFGVNGSI
ncbi:hypothetical protein [Mucilaginibacter sp.]|jgi:hypothetical protein|uniref:hypothetical protein n=1 Tax=Mucilaginibacter sp. TaxID=1882438 RepID=UPI002CA86A8A|nr:hypothetical protein [Mucilaginibacter sp.]HTI57372.1 hypothetical protein [Mucilaginibacter sp.]